MKRKCLTVYCSPFTVHGLKDLNDLKGFNDFNGEKRR